jgi:hypothetical protein
MPATFQMVPLKMSILDIEGNKTYFFKVIYNYLFISIIYLINRLVFRIINLLMSVLDYLVKLNLERIKWLLNHVLVVVLMKKLLKSSRKSSINDNKEKKRYSIDSFFLLIVCLCLICNVSTYVYDYHLIDFVFFVTFSEVKKKKT